jgi:hypothetical protein
MTLRHKAAKKTAKAKKAATAKRATTATKDRRTAAK